MRGWLSPVIDAVDEQKRTEHARRPGHGHSQVSIDRLVPSAISLVDWMGLANSPTALPV